MKDLTKRFVVSLTISSILLAFVVFSTHGWVRVLLTILIGVMGAIGIWEYARFAKVKDLQPATRWMMGAGFCEVLCFHIASLCTSCAQLPLIILVFSAILFFLLHFRDPTRSLIHVAIEFFGLCYVAVPLGMMLTVLYMQGTEDGRIWIAYLIVVTKIVDVSGYFVGKLLGRRPLAPVLSPQKTIEGSIGGFISAVIVSIGFYFLSFHVTGFHLSLTWALVLGMGIGVLGQVGDLAESMFKRDAAVKDSNNLPGLGGILDLLDSLIFTSPLVYLFLRMAA